MFAIQCKNRLYNYNRYVGLKSSGNPQIVYESSSNFPKAIKGFREKEAAEKFLTKIITREGVDIYAISARDIVDYALISDSTEFRIVEYKIQNEKFEIIDSYQFTPVIPESH